MDSATRKLLVSADDPVCGEHPTNLSWEKLNSRIRALQPELERISGQVFIYDPTQDASFFADLSTQRFDSSSSVIRLIVALRFSNFADLFTLWSVCHEGEELSSEIIAELIQATTRSGFHLVNADDLDETYDGCHPGFAGTTWRDRFFDYL